MAKNIVSKEVNVPVDSNRSKLTVTISVGFDDDDESQSVAVVTPTPAPTSQSKEKVARTAKKFTKKKKRSTNNVLDWVKIVDTDEKRSEICESLENNGPQCSRMIDLCRATYNDVVVGQWGYKEVPLTEKSGSDNIRKGISDLATGRSHNNVSCNYVIRLGDEIINRPTKEALARDESKHKVYTDIKYPLFWYTDEQGSKINPFA